MRWNGCRWMRFFARADFLSLECPLTPETEKVVNAEAVEENETFGDRNKYWSRSSN